METFERSFENQLWPFSHPQFFSSHSRQELFPFETNPLRCIFACVCVSDCVSSYSFSFPNCRYAWVCDIVLFKNGKIFTGALYPFSFSSSHLSTSFVCALLFPYFCLPPLLLSQHFWNSCCCPVCPVCGDIGESCSASPTQIHTIPSIHHPMRVWLVVFVEWECE